MAGRRDEPTLGTRGIGKDGGAVLHSHEAKKGQIDYDGRRLWNLNGD